MPSVVACPKCKTKYSLPDHIIGKRVKCKTCGSAIQTRRSTRSSAQPGAAQAKAEDAAAKAKQVAAQKRAEAMQELGLDGAIVTPPDLFASAPVATRGPDPLSNHVVVDPGFAAVESPTAESVTPETTEHELSSLFENPALMKAEPTQRATQTAGVSQGGLGKQVWFWLLCIFVPMILVAGGLPLLVNSVGITWIFLTCALLGLVSSAVSIWGFVLVYQTTPDALQVILAIFVPFYIIYYCVKHWSSMKPFVFATLAIMGLAMLTVAMIVANGVNEFTNQLQ